MDLIKWIKPALTKFLPRPSFIEDTNCMPSGNLSQKYILTLLEHDRAYRRLDVMKLRNLKKICDSLVIHTNSQFEYRTTGVEHSSPVPVVSEREERKQEYRQNAGLSIEMRLSHAGNRFLKIASEQSALMEDVESIPFNTDKFKQWNRLSSQMEQLQQEFIEIQELPGVEGISVS